MPIFSLPKLSKTCTSYSPIRYTPEFEPFGTMNSTSTVQSPNFCSVKMSTPPDPALTSSPSRPGASVTANWLGSLSARAALPTRHLLLDSSLPLSFQPSRDLPLNGVTGLSSAATAGPATRAARAATRARQAVRVMAAPCGVSGAGRRSVRGPTAGVQRPGSAGTPVGSETAGVAPAGKAETARATRPGRTGGGRHGLLGVLSDRAPGPPPPNEFSDPAP